MLQQDGKRPDGTTLLPLAPGKPMAWDVIVPDTYAESHVSNTAREAEAAANRESVRKTAKYGALPDSHIFVPVAIETAGTWGQSALVQEIGKRITTVTEDTRETMFLFQRLSIAFQKGNAIAFQTTFETE